MSVWSYVGVYMLGGLTLLPGVVLIGYYLSPPAVQVAPVDSDQEIEEQTEQFAGPVQASTYFNLSPHFINLSEAEDDFGGPKVKAREQLRNSLDPAGANTNRRTSLSKVPKYYGTVKGSALQLWTDDTKSRLISTINLGDFVVTLWPQGAEDYELFYKKFPIVLISKKTPEGLVSLDMHPKEPPANSQYIYVDNPCAKEDLYFALIAGSRAGDTSSMGPRDPKVMASPIDIDPEDIHELLNRIYSSNETPQTQWINALLGRLFLAVKFSRQLDDYIKYKIVYKLSKVKPSFIGEIEVQNIKVGTSLPYFNDIHLKSFSVDGNMTVEGNVVYSGGFSLDVLFTCYVKVPGLARREFRCVLAVKLRSLEGTLVVRVKPPPSSHLWYAFKEMPKMDLKIEPTVANRQVGYSFITSALNSMISDALKESMVLPYMDDIPFCETEDEFYRGGIWDASERPRNVSWTQEKRPKQYDSEHEVILRDDASSVSSGKSARSMSMGDGNGEATPKPITKFWNNLIRRKTVVEPAADPVPSAFSSGLETRYDTDAESISNSRRPSTASTCGGTTPDTSRTPVPSTSVASTPAHTTPAPGTPAPGTPVPSTPVPSTPAHTTPALGTPASGTPASGTPAPSTPAPSTPVPSAPGTPSSPDTPSAFSTYNFPQTQSDMAPTDASYRKSHASISTTAVTPASVHGVQARMYVPPGTFAARKPVPATVTTTNADFDPVRQPEYMTLDPHAPRPQSVRRKPVGSEDMNRTVRPSRSLQQLNRVVSMSSNRGHSPSSSVSRARRGHSPTSSIGSHLSSSSRLSSASHRRRLRLEALDPEPQPQPEY